MTEPVALRVAVGRRVRDLRESYGARQEDISTAARDFGLTWSRSKVAALERGEKALSAEELLLLPALLSLAFTSKGHQATVTMNDLLTVGDLVRLTPAATVKRDALPSLLGDEPAVDLPGPSASQAAAIAESVNRTSSRLQALRVKAPVSRLSALHATAGEAEDNAARRLGEPRAVVLALAGALWGRSLSAERDERLRTAVDENTSAATIRAKRGRITRELVAELAAEIERRGHGEHRKTRRPRLPPAGDLQVQRMPTASGTTTPACSSGTASR